MYKSSVILLLFVLSGCSEKDNPLSYSAAEIMEFKEIAWNDLSEEELATVTITMEESEIKYAKITRKEGIYYYITDNTPYTFIRTHPEVDYRTKQTFVVVIIDSNSLLGPITIIIEPDSRKVFGRGTRL